MKITEDQIRVLESFHCERLSASEENRHLIANFTNDRGAELVKYLQNDGWKFDCAGNEAFYLVKNAEGEAMLFFTLICGALFQPLAHEEIQLRVSKFEELKKAVKGGDARRATELLESLRTEQIPIEQYIKEMAFERAILSRAADDKRREINQQINRVLTVYPGIEIKHLCVNDRMREYWGGCGIDKQIGEVMFWYFIVPKICEIQKLVGVQFVYLFAADLSSVGSLINYYNVSLKFEQVDILGTNKPLYDFSCTFMCQEIERLKENRNLYFDHFNPDSGDVLV